MKPLSPETLAFIRTHRSDDTRVLALQAKKYAKVDMTEAIVQIAGRQIAEKKIPSWAEREDIRYPQHLSMEQCSSEVTARYKASLAEGESFTDLTGGFGVDCAFIASRFRQADYVERQEALCELAAHNFALLGLNQIKVHHADGIDYLQQMEPVDCLYLDPARRNNHGGKTIAISDCEPDVSQIESLLVEKGKLVMVKLSPMLDVTLAIQTLKHISQVHIVAVDNECKELILLLKNADKDTENTTGKEIVICCEQAVNNLLTIPFTFTLSEEKNAVCEYACQAGKYLYEPGASLLKAGAYRLIGSRYNVKKLHPNSHLYTSDTLIDFPGRSFQVEAVSGFGKKELKTFLQGMERANITVRNFPSSVAELRKKLKLKEGGDTYLFATTLKGEEKVLIKCAKASVTPAPLLSL